MPVILTCQNCSLDYSVKPSKRARSKYCSRYCHAKKTIAVESKKEKKCKECGSIFSRRASIASVRIFCSVKCAKVSWGRSYSKKGEDHSRYVNGSGVYRAKAIDHYGPSCSKCGSSEHVEVHHVDKDRGNNEIENLEVLCRKCHHKEHSIFNLNGCLCCGETVKRHNNKYCSRSCFARSMRKTTS